MGFQPDESNFAAMVRRELIRARAKHPECPSHHHAMSVITEEFVELRGEVYKQARNPFKILEELVHLAATCERFAEDLKYADLVSVNVHHQAAAFTATGATFDQFWDRAYSGKLRYEHGPGLAGVVTARIGEISDTMLKQQVDLENPKEGA